MALTEIPSELSSTPSIVDNGNATAITIGSDESATFAGTLAVTGALTVDTNTLVVDATNNRVGIGITPATLLDIKESTAATDAIIGLTAGTGGRAQIRSEAQADNTSSELSFHTMSGSNTSEAMRILADGSVAIGTAALPTSVGGVAPQMVLKQGATNSSGIMVETSANDSLIRMFHNGSAGILSASYGSTGSYTPLVLETGGAERMRIDSDGTISIPNQNAINELSFTGTEFTNVLSATTSGFQLGTTGAGYLSFLTNNTERMRIVESGAVTVTANTTSDWALAVNNGTNSNAFGLYINAPSTSAIPLRVDGGGSERMRIDSGGRVGVFNSSPANYTGAGARSLVVGSNSSATDPHGITIVGGSSSTSNLAFTDNAGDGSANDYRGLIQYYHPDDSLRVFVASAERMRIAADGSITMPDVYNDTTAAAANMHISSAGGLLFRSTSSARYKNTITDATHGLTELLTLRSVTYKGNNDGDTVFGGLIAEEVHDAGLTEFVQYNDEDEPDALAYGNMVSLCIKAIQELKEELNTATARITELENN